MVEIFQNIVRSDILVFVALVGAFIYLSRSALNQHEYTGYGLGWMIGLFFVLIYSSTITQAPADETLDTNVTLTLFEVLLPTFCGVFVGVGLLMLIGLAQNTPRRYTLLVATITAINVILIFLFFFTTSDLRRQIGIFALSFAICAITTSVLVGQSRTSRGFGAQSVPMIGSPLDDPQQGGMMPSSGKSRLDQIREQFRSK
jgi:ABC-type nitrate/sulfonate/bicarbonate transport system permease component